MKRIKRSRPFVDETDVEAVADVVRSGAHGTGRKTAEFERAICRYIGAEFGKATNSGTSALFLALKSLGTEANDEVILPSYVCASVLSAVRQCGAVPVLADLAPTGFNIGAGQIEPKLTRRTRAVIVPHLFGTPADLGPIMDLGIPVIEDCAQALGASYQGRRVGSIADVGIYSFYATKLISTGQGGMVVTSSTAVQERLDDLTTYDNRATYGMSYNLGLTDIQAALGITQLEKLDGFIQRRRAIAASYDRAFGAPQDWRDRVPFKYVIEVADARLRTRLVSHLQQADIGVGLPVFRPLHHYLNLDPNDYPHTERAFNQSVALPLYAALTDQEVDRTITEVCAVMAMSR